MPSLKQIRRMRKGGFRIEPETGPEDSRARKDNVKYKGKSYRACDLAGGD
jgi:hypothetical protein